MVWRFREKKKQIIFIQYHERESVASSQIHHVQNYANVIMKLIAPARDKTIACEIASRRNNAAKKHRHSRTVMLQHYYSLCERITRKSDTRKKINGD